MTGTCEDQRKKGDFSQFKYYDSICDCGEHCESVELVGALYGHKVRRIICPKCDSVFRVDRAVRGREVTYIKHEKDVYSPKIPLIVRVIKWLRKPRKDK